MESNIVCFFFFQAEDGIRDYKVTGVQTCALPILFSFSPLNKLNTANVKNLVPRMVFTHGAERLGSFETTPVVAGGIMYITSPATPNNVVTAYDLRTAKQLWRYEHKNAAVSTACCGPNNRGVALAGGAVYVATLDGELVALDQQSGKEKWVAKVGDPEFGYTETMAPLV